MKKTLYIFFGLTIILSSMLSYLIFDEFFIKKENVNQADMENIEIEKVEVEKENNGEEGFKDPYALIEKSMEYAILGDTKGVLSLYDPEEKMSDNYEQRMEASLVLYGDWQDYQVYRDKEIGCMLREDGVEIYSISVGIETSQSEAYMNTNFSLKKRDDFWYAVDLAGYSYAGECRNNEFPI